MALKRFVDGAAGQPFFQKRAPDNRPDWIRTATLTFPSGRTADEIVIDDAAGLAWVVNLGCIDLNPHPVRAEDLDHPDELRVDLDPVPGVPWSQIREVALVAGRRSTRSASSAGRRRRARAGSTSTSGSSRAGRIPEVRRAALALARDVERRAPDAGDVEMVEGGAPRRLPRLQPERQGPNGGLGLLGPATAGCAGLHAARLGRGPDRRGGGVHDRHRPRRATRRSAIRAPGSTTRSGRSKRCSSYRRGTRPRVRATPRGHRTTRSRPASRRGSSRRGSAGRRRVRGRARARPAARRRRWPPGAPGRRRAGRPERRACRTEWAGSRPTPTGRRRSAIPVVEIARAEHKDEALAGLRAVEGAASARGRGARAGGRPGRLDARPLDDLDPRPGQPDPRAGGGSTGPGAARGRLRPMGRLRVARPGGAAGASAAQPIPNAGSGREADHVRSTTGDPMARRPFAPNPDAQVAEPAVLADRACRTRTILSAESRSSLRDGTSALQIGGLRRGALTDRIQEAQEPVGMHVRSTRGSLVSATRLRH